MENGGPSEREATGNPGAGAAGTLWWQLQQAPPICPTCRTYCPCRRTMLQECGRVQYRYCDTCDYKTKTIVPVR
jgi:hypothetical protein